MKKGWILSGVIIVLTALAMACGDSATSVPVTTSDESVLTATPTAVSTPTPKARATARPTPTPLPPGFIVDSTADVVDANPGDGICDDGSGNCTLRAAIMEANASPGADTINLSADTYILSIPGTNPLRITDDLTINGAGARATIIDADRLYRVILIDVPSTVGFFRMAIQNGESETGGGISNEDGTLTLIDSFVSGNSAEERGGGILNLVGGQLTLKNSRVNSNTADRFGGGIFNQNSTLTVTDS
jgi:CSLREA domain-containing protein